MTVAVAADPPLDDLRRLLAAANLPADDVDPLSRRQRYFGVQAGGRWNAVIGLELLGGAALLRSLAVDPAARGQGLGRALVEHIEDAASAAGVAALYLLTTDAVEYFRKMGYDPVDRGQAPAAVREHAQFRSLCPSSAQVLVKRLRGAGESGSVVRPA